MEKKSLLATSFFPLFIGHSPCRSAKEEKNDEKWVGSLWKGNMKKKLLGLILAVFMMFALAMNAGGEEAKPEAKGEAKPGAKPAISLEEIKNLLGLSI